MTDWHATHKITFTPQGTPRRRFEWLVMLSDEGAAYTRSEWLGCDAADWVRVGKAWMFQGQAAPGNGTVTVRRVPR